MLYCVLYYTNIMARTTKPYVSEAELKNRENGLLDLGLTQKTVDKLREKMPSLYTKAEASERITGLKNLGFSDPVAMINALPQILNLHTSTIKDKVEKMSAEIPNALAFMEACPATLTYSPEANVGKKIKMVDELVRLYKLPFTTAEIIRRNNSILSSSMDKLWVVARILKKYTDSPADLRHKHISNLLFENIENVLIALEETEKEDLTFNRFLDAVKKVKKRNLPNEKKQELIEQMSFQEGSENDKIHARYFRGLKK